MTWFFAQHDFNHFMIANFEIERGSFETSYSGNKYVFIDAVSATDVDHRPFKFHTNLYNLRCLVVIRTERRNSILSLILIYDNLAHLLTTFFCSFHSVLWREVKQYALEWHNNLLLLRAIVLLCLNSGCFYANVHAFCGITRIQAQQFLLLLQQNQPFCTVTIKYRRRYCSI